MPFKHALRYLITNIYTKWILIVGLNAVLGFILGHETENYLHLLGMIAGVVTWFFIYLFMDKYLLKTGRTDMSRKLSLSAAFRIPLQFLFLPDVYAGLAAIVTLEFLGLHVMGGVVDGKWFFIESYFTTVFTGLYLSLMCALIYPIITQVDAIRGRRSGS
jgi:uncharacterized membrane protein